MLAAKVEFQAGKLEKLFFVFHDLGLCPLTLRRPPGCQNIFETVPINLRDAVAVDGVPLAALSYAVEDFRARRMHLNIFADAAGLRMAADQRSMLLRARSAEILRR